MTPKLLRGQLRQIVTEMMPELIKHRFYEEIQNEIKSQLKVMDQRHRETMMAILRNIQPQVAPKSEDK